MNVNKQKAAQLGMPIGTANGRLRKMLLFSMAQKLNEDICYRCEQKIETIEEFTIEHKEPWFGEDTQRFWDLHNISFSHLICNIKAGRKSGGGHNRIVSPQRIVVVFDL